MSTSVTSSNMMKDFSVTISSSRGVSCVCTSTHSATGALAGVEGKGADKVRQGRRLTETQLEPKWHGHFGNYLNNTLPALHKPRANVNIDFNLLNLLNTSFTAKFASSRFRPSDLQVGIFPTLSVSMAKLIAEWRFWAIFESTGVSWTLPNKGPPTY